MTLESSKSESKVTAAFTLIELLVVMAIIGILMGLLFPALSAARHRARVTRTRMEMRQIETAWISYRNDYRDFPPRNLFGGGAQQFAGEMNQNAVNILRGVTVENYNLRQIAYMDFSQALTQFNDPWGAVYRFSLSTWPPPNPPNPNEVMFQRTWAFGFEILPRPVAVYSTGSAAPNAPPIMSWQ